jgi:hypothetical protein
MSKRSILPTNPTAAQVRQALGLPSKRGQLSEAHIAEYNKGKRADKRYVRGNTNVAKAQTQAQRQALRESGVTVGKRGPLSKAAQAALKV